MLTIVLCLLLLWYIGEDLVERVGEITHTNAGETKKPNADCSVDDPLYLGVVVNCIYM